MRPEQQELIDTTPLGLWGGVGSPDLIERAADAGGGPCPVCDTFTTHLFCSKACAAQYAQQPAPAPEPPPKPTGPRNHSCLRCGKDCFKMFCSAKCKATWQSSMSAWQARMNRTAIEGEQELF